MFHFQMRISGAKQKVIPGDSSQEKQKETSE